MPRRKQSHHTKPSVGGITKTRTKKKALPSITREALDALTHDAGLLTTVRKPQDEHKTQQQQQQKQQKHDPELWLGSAEDRRREEERVKKRVEAGKGLEDVLAGFGVL